MDSATLLVRATGNSSDSCSSTYVTVWNIKALKWWSAQRFMDMDHYALHIQTTDIFALGTYVLNIRNCPYRVYVLRLCLANLHQFL